MNIIGLDEIDNKILEVIKDDARLSYSDIGERVGISRVSVKNRMDAMEEKGIIAGYHTIIDSARIPEGRKFFLEAEIEPEKYASVIEILAASPVVKKINVITGNSKIMVEGLADSNRTMNTFSYSIFNNTPGLKNIVFHMILDTLKDVDGGVDYEKRKEDISTN